MFFNADSSGITVSFWLDVQIMHYVGLGPELNIFAFHDASQPPVNINQNEFPLLKSQNFSKWTSVIYVN